MFCKMLAFFSHLHVFVQHFIKSLRPGDAYTSVNWVSIGSGNVLSPVWCQAIVWANAELLPDGHQWTRFNEIWITI